MGFPVPNLDVPVVNSDGYMNQSWFEFFKSFSADFGTLLDNFNTLDAASASFLTTAGHQNVTGGFTSTEFDNGTPTNGSSVTINPSNGLKQVITNNVAGFTITATAECGDVELRIINGASAGTITFSGFDKKWSSDPLDTVSGNQFMVFIYGFAAKKAYLIKALQ